MTTQNPLSALAAIAESQIGTQEDSAHTNRGAAILKYQQAASLGGQGWPWCAAFVDWCVESFITRFPGLCGVRIEDRPTTASAFDFEDWGKAHACEVFTDPKRAQRGDILIFTFSHIGIVDSNDGGTLCTVEGNTNDDGGRDGYEVAHRDRSHEAVHGLVRCFVRLPARAVLV